MVKESESKQSESEVIRRELTQAANDYLSNLTYYNCGGQMAEESKSRQDEQKVVRQELAQAVKLLFVQLNILQLRWTDGRQSESKVIRRELTRTVK